MKVNFGSKADDGLAPPLAAVGLLKLTYNAFVIVHEANAGDTESNDQLSEFLREWGDIHASIP